MRSLPRALLLVGLAAAGLACATLLEPPATEEEREAFARAEAQAQTGDDARRRAFEEFLARHPDSALAGDASLELAGVARRAGELAEAERRYREAVDAGGLAADRARVELAALALEGGDNLAARRWLDRVRLSRLEEADLRNAYRLFAQTSARPAERIRWLAQLRAVEPDPADLAAVDAEIDAMLAVLPPDELEAAARQVGERPPAGRVQIELAERALEQGDLAAASAALEEAQRIPLAPRYAARLAAVEARVRSQQAGPTRVDQLMSFDEAALRPPPELAGARGALGVVLPLSGPFARFGEEALEGVLLAAGTFPGPDGARGPEMRIAVRDSAGDPARAAQAVRELAADERIQAIVGPLVPAACEAAAREAEAAGIPLLAITSREDVARDREWVFRVRTRPVEEAQILADRAIALGAQRFAILYPDDPYGLGLRALFWDAVEARGGRVVAVASFDPNATDFGESIRRLVGYTLLDAEQKQVLAARDGMLDRARRLPPAEARALRQQAHSLTTADGRPVPPIVDFEALFLPASREQLVLIAPQLAFHEVTGPRLLATDGSYDDEVLRLAGDHVEGALFATHFHADSDVPYVADFRERFEAVFGAPPGAFAAQGYDAASLALLQLARGRRDREAVRDGVLQTTSHPGVSGVLTMRADGNAQKRPYLLGIEDGRVIEYTD